MEWGTYLGQFESNPARLKQAITAFRKAIELNPADTHSPQKRDHSSASLVNILMQKAAKAFDKQDWAGAASLFEDALSYAPSTMSKDHLASLHENAAACRYNSGDHEAAAKHYDEAFELTGKKEYKDSAADARK
jgi:tetratricopeptide (TPR) repeat protein